MGATDASSSLPGASADRWTRDNATVLAVCMLGWGFDVYESTITQLVTPILIKEWNISPATMGAVTTVSRWIGIIGAFAFPVLADLYGRKRVLIWSILGYSVLTGLTGFATGWISLLIFLSLTRIFLSGENPVGMIMVTETAPTKWRATALAGLFSGTPLGYMLCSAVALLVVPVFGWRYMYFLGVLPALLLVWIRLGIQESPRHEYVTAQMLKEGLKRRLDILSPMRQYPRETLATSLVAFLYLFTWFGWSAWMPFFLATEKKLGFQVMTTYVTIWMACAFFSYWLCGWLCDLFGRRVVMPAFIFPGVVCLLLIGHIDDPNTLFWFGLVTNFIITGCFGPGLGYINEPFPTEIRGAGVAAAVTFGVAGGSFAPLIAGWIATLYSVAAALPLFAVTFALLIPLFAWIIPDTTRKPLTDFVGQKVT